MSENKLYPTPHDITDFLFCYFVFDPIFIKQLILIQVFVASSPSQALALVKTILFRWLNLLFYEFALKCYQNQV